MHDEEYNEYEFEHKHPESRLENDLKVAEWFVKITGASWKHALDCVKVNPDKILKDCLGLGTSKAAREYAAHKMGLFHGYERGRDQKLYTLRVICCPFNQIERVQTTLSDPDIPENQRFILGRMDELITSNPLAAEFAPGITGTEYYLICANGLDETWHLKSAGELPFVFTERRRLRWIENPDFYCEKALELDGIVARFTKARCVDEVRCGLQAIETYLSKLVKVEKTMRTYKH